MNINLTRNQYRALLKLIYLGEWMMNSHNIGEETESDKLEQHLYSFAGTYDSDDWVEKEKESGVYYPTHLLEEELDDYIDDYDEYTFWEELTHRLAKRDYYQSAGMQKIAKMEPFELMVEEDKIVKKYSDEFDKNGLKNLHLK